MIQNDEIGRRRARRAGSAAIALVLALLSAPWAWAQEDPTEATAPPREGISIDLNVNYRLAYRDKTWVPVDVIVTNNAYDITGYVELRAYSGDDLQSPVYRVAAECPKASRKRFRFYCMLDMTTRVETMIYHKGRAVQDVAPWLTLQPIRAEDLMALVLDKEPTDYGFLNVALMTGVTGPNGEGVRFYREEVSSDSLGLLADYAQCYEPYDAIILGNLDPDQVSERHRSLLRRYVEMGGMLIVCVGENGVNFRGTWVEALTGCEIGASRLVTEPELAGLVLATEQDREGVKPTRQAQFTELKPLAAEARVWGGQTPLAVLRPWGSGMVATLAVDSASHVLQDTQGYQRLWRELCQWRRVRGDLHYNEAALKFAQELPNVSGITIQPKNSVMMYLGLYFIFGIVLNWLVFSALKRRELAWLCLVVISIGFTAYALVYGTAGRAKASRVHQVEVLRVAQVPPDAAGGAGSEASPAPSQDAPPAGGAPTEASASAVPSVPEEATRPTAPPTQCLVRSVTGIISARSRAYRLDLPTDYSLVEDMHVVRSALELRQASATARRPFQLNEGIQSSVESFGVGASEVRTIQVHSELALPGGIDGVLEVQDDARGTSVSGTLVNNTGFELTDPYIVLGDANPSVRVEGKNLVVSSAVKTSFSVELEKLKAERAEAERAAVGKPPDSPEAKRVKELVVQEAEKEALLKKKREDQRAARQRNMASRQRTRVATPADPMSGSETLYNAFVSTLLRGSESGGGSVSRDRACLVARIKSGLQAPVRVEGMTAPPGGVSFLVADVAIKTGATRGTWQPLAIVLPGKEAKVYPRPGDPRWFDEAYESRQSPSGPGWPVSIRIPPDMLALEPGRLTLDLSWSPGWYAMSFAPKTPGFAWLQTAQTARSQQQAVMSNTSIGGLSYTIEDWRPYYDEQSGRIDGFIQSERGYRSNEPTFVCIRGELWIKRTSVDNQDWRPWIQVASAQP